MCHNYLYLKKSSTHGYAWRRIGQGVIINVYLKGDKMKDIKNVLLFIEVLV